MTFTVLIPARLASTRLPRKPLADIGGVPMIVRVARRAALSSATRVVVAADDDAIVAACHAGEVEAILTASTHASGSDRLAEACGVLGLDGDAIVVNVQGDEPMIEPALIEACAALLQARPDCAVSTVAHAIADPRDFADRNVVKVVLDAASRALYFSRAPIPWPRDAAASAVVSDERPSEASMPLPSPAPLRHVGLYAYRAAFLRRFPQLERCPLEASEQLEQLRVLWHGERIAVHVSRGQSGIGVDTPADLERVRLLVGVAAAPGFA